MRSTFKFTSLLTVLLVLSLNSRSVNSFAALLGMGARLAAKAAVKAGGKAIAKKAASQVAKKAAVSMAKRGASSVAKNAAKSVAKKAGNQIKSQAVKQVKSQAKSMLKKRSQASSPEAEQQQQQPDEEQESPSLPSNNFPPPTQPFSPAEQVVQEAPPAYNPNVVTPPIGFTPSQAPVYQTPPVMTPNMYTSPILGGTQYGPIPYTSNPSFGNNNNMMMNGGIPSYMSVPGYFPSHSMAGGIPTSGNYPYLPPNTYGATFLPQPPGTSPQYSYPGSPQYSVSQQQYLPQMLNSQFTGNAPVINGQCYCPCAIQREQVYNDESPCYRRKGGRRYPRRRRPAVRVINLGDVDDLNNALIAAGIDLPTSTIQNFSASTLIES